MRPSFFLCRVFGCLPYKISQSSFRPSLIGYVYSSILTTTFIIACATVIYHVDISGDLGYTNVPGMLQQNCYTLFACLFSVGTYAYSSKRMQLLQDIEVISSLIPMQNFQRNAKYIHAKDIIGFCIVLCLVSNLKGESFYEVVTDMTALFGTLLFFVMDTLYINCVFMISQSFDLITIQLKKLKETMKKEKVHILRKHYHEQNNPLILMKLNNVIRTYHHTSNVLENTNSVFVIQILSTVTFTFIEVTFSLYFYILRNWGTADINYNVRRQIWVKYFIASISFYLTKLIAIISVGQWTKEAAYTVGVQIHDTLMNTTDKEIKYEACSKFIKKSSIFIK